jgi:hypothetical protein
MSDTLGFFVRFLLLIPLIGGFAGSAATAKACRMKKPDIAIYGIELTDTESAAKQVGPGPEMTEGGDDLPHARFASSDGKEELRLFASYAAAPDEYTEAEVLVADKQAMVLKSLPTETFATPSGIKLGATRKEVVGKLGTCFESETGGADETLRYELDGLDRDPALMKYGYSDYYADYEFSHGKLVRFRFGFVHP